MSIGTVTQATVATGDPGLDALLTGGVRFRVDAVDGSVYSGNIYPFGDGVTSIERLGSVRTVVRTMTKLSRVVTGSIPRDHGGYVLAFWTVEGAAHHVTMDFEWFHSVAEEPTEDRFWNDVYMDYVVAHQADSAAAARSTT